MTPELVKGSLVLYRSEAALVVDITKEKKHQKILLQNQSGKKISVRPKDILLLGVVKNLEESTVLLERKELQEGWQLLQELGESCSLAELAEAVFGATSPCELYNAFLLINETPYFKGRPDAIVVRSDEQVEEELRRKHKKQREAEAWQCFYEHSLNAQFTAEDQPFIQEIEAIAYGEKQHCRLFREIKLESTPEHAHAWLLRHGIWQEQHNPYPRRNQIQAEVPRVELSLELWQDFLRDFVAAMPAIPVPELNTATQEPLTEGQLAPIKAVLKDFCNRQTVQFPPVSEAPPLPQAWQTAERRNLTHLTAWAIDDPWSRDPDDAISIEAGALWIHIADPATLLPYGSPVAEQALQRAASVYLPEKTCAMLPEDLIAILGLGLQPVNMALSVKVALSEEGSSTLELCRSWVRVQRISYEQADTLLAEQHPLQQPLQPSLQPSLQHPLAQIWQICRTHEKLRQNNNAVQFNMYNTKIVAGDPIQIEALPNTPSRNLVAEAMLIAGAAMAQYAQQHQVPMPYLCQAPPKDQLPPLDSMANMFAARKLLSPSTVHTEPSLHSGIGLLVYTRTTSPLRRYLDLLAHQQLHALLLSSQDLRFLNREELLYLSAQAEMQISRVNNAQRCSQQHWQMLYLKQEGKQRHYRAIVLDLRGSKAWCSLPEIGLETSIFSKKGLQRNQEIEVVLKSVQLCTREAHFQITSQIDQDTDTNK